MKARSKQEIYGKPKTFRNTIQNKAKQFILHHKLEYKTDSAYTNLGQMTLFCKMSLKRTPLNDLTAVCKNEQEL